MFIHVSVCTFIYMNVAWSPFEDMIYATLWAFIAVKWDCLIHVPQAKERYYLATLLLSNNIHGYLTSFSKFYNTPQSVCVRIHHPLSLKMMAVTLMGSDQYLDVHNMTTRWSKERYSRLRHTVHNAGLKFIILTLFLPDLSVC